MDKFAGFGVVAERAADVMVPLVSEFGVVFGSLTEAVEDVLTEVVVDGVGVAEAVVEAGAGVINPTNSTTPATKRCST